MRLNTIIFLMVSMSIIILFTPKVSADTVSPPEYGYGYWEVWSDGSNDDGDMHFFMNWSKDQNVDNYNIYLYYPVTKKYYRKTSSAKENPDFHTGENFMMITEKNIDNLDKYLENGCFRFRITSVKNGIESPMSKEFISEKGDTDSLKSPQKIKYSKQDVALAVRKQDITKYYTTPTKKEAAAAIKEIKKSGVYRRAMINFYEVKAENSICAKNINSDGSIKMTASRKYTLDMDGDGKKESFIFVYMPYINTPYDIPYYVPVFKSSDNKMTVLTPFMAKDTVAAIIDFGTFKQFYFGCDDQSEAGFDVCLRLYGLENAELKSFDLFNMGISVKNGMVITYYVTYYYSKKYKNYVVILDRSEKIFVLENHGVRYYVDSIPEE